MLFRFVNRQKSTSFIKIKPIWISLLNCSSASSLSSMFISCKVFRKFPKDLFVPTKSMAANQGLYNGFLAAGLLWTFFISDPIWREYIALFFLSCVAVAGIFGALTADKKIFFLQGLPAIVAIVLLLLS